MMSKQLGVALSLALSVTFVSSLHAEPGKPYRRSKTSSDDRHKISEGCEALRKQAPRLDTLTSSQLMAFQVTLSIFDCEDWPPLARTGWLMDTLDTIGQPSELVRTGYVLGCLQPERYEIEGTMKTAPLYMACGHDARALDRKAFEAELAKLKLSPILETIAVARFIEVQALASTLTEDFAKLGPEYKQILIDAPDRAWGVWEKLHTSHHAAFEEIHAFEDAYASGDKSKLEGCHDRLTRGFHEYLTEQRPRTADDATATANDPLGAAWLSALAVCDAVQGRYALARRELAMSTAGKRRHGPRAMALGAAATALSAARGDADDVGGEHVQRRPTARGQKRFPIAPVEGWMVPAPAEDYGDYPRGQADEMISQNLRGSHGDDWASRTGLVASVAASGDYVVVGFKSVKAQVDDASTLSCTSTGEIESISSDGHVNYGKVCEVGTKTIEVGLPKVAIRKDLAAGIKVGVVVEVTIEEDRLVNKVAEALPLGVFRDEAKKKPVAMYGVVLLP